MAHTATTSDDAVLLGRYAAAQDPEAFMALVQRYAHMVYGVCLRITGSSADAEDATQECLLELARKAGSIQGSLGGWLHTVAARRSLMICRSRSRRSRREQHCAVAEEKPDPTTALQVSEAVDAALEELDAESRDLVIRRYLQGNTQQQIAEVLGIDQSAVSRRLAKAIEDIRTRLSAMGVTCGVLSVKAVLDSAANVTAPPHAMAMAGKFALAGVGSAGASASLAVKLAAYLVLGAGLATGIGVWIHKGRLMHSSTAVTAHVQTIDMSKLRLRGFGMTQDTVTLSMQAAANALGRPADYDRLYCLSGNAFAPAINTYEGCASWWHVKANMGTQNLPAMAQSVGLRAEAIAVPKLPARPTPEQETEFVRASVGAIREAMASGAVVIAEGGWDEDNAWDWAGPVTTVASDGIVRGNTLSPATLDGKVDVPLRYARTIWAIRPIDTTLAIRDADRAILRNAIARIRGEGAYQKSGDLIYGLAAMDRWIEQMRDVRGFCAHCFGVKPIVGVYDASDNDQRMYVAAKIVQAQLRDGIKTLPEGSQRYLTEAADCYARIAQLLEPAATGRGFSYDSLNSIERQQEYARDVLGKIKTELDFAAAQMERALAIDEGATLLPKAIAAVDAVGRTTGDMNPVRTNHLMRVAMARAVGREDVDYDTLIVLSGDATSFAYHPRNYFVMYQPVDAVEAVEERLIDGTGFGWHRFPNGHSPEAAWKIMKDSVDSGRPLLAAWRDDFVVAGYQDSADVTQRRIYTLGKWSVGQWMTWQEWVEWCTRFGWLRGPSGEDRQQLDMTRTVLERMVWLATAGTPANVDLVAQGKFGLQGMEAYAADVADMSKGPDYFDAGWLACHAINRQGFGRAAAARWLAKVAQSQSPGKREHLQKASELYAKSFQAFVEFRQVLSPPPGSKFDTQLREYWSDPSRRQKGAALIRQAAQHEEQAIADIRQAL